MLDVVMEIGSEVLEGLAEVIVGCDAVLLCFLQGPQGGSGRVHCQIGFSGKVKEDVHDRIMGEYVSVRFVVAAREGEEVSEHYNGAVAGEGCVAGHIRGAGV